jgi:uncharacterized protein YdeI (BOF family)
MKSLTPRDVSEKSRRFTRFLKHSYQDLQQERRHRFRSQLRVECLERRDLLAADLGVESHALPREPADLLALDRQHYAELSAQIEAGNEDDYQPLVPLSDSLLLHSRPDASKTIYLDFDGFTNIGTAWNASRGREQIISPAWDPDGDGADFSDNELRRIQGVWQRVSADFAAFDVNVTTEDPGEAALVNSGGNDTSWGIRVVLTGDDFPGPGSGGVAYIGSFNWGKNDASSTDTPAYVFNLGELAAAAAATHEVGHSIGLQHDGTTNAHPSQPSAEYYNGHGNGENAWGPIMGAGYYRNVSTWDDGTYFAASNGSATANYGDGPDDIAVIVSENGFGFVPDPESNTPDNASSLIVELDEATGLANISQFGVIRERNDVDFFRFQMGSGTINLDIDPYVTEAWTATPSGEFSRSVETSYFNNSNWAQNQGANLDVEATLFDADGNEVARSNPAGLRASFRNLDLEAGVYTIRIDGAGFGTPTANPPTGYSDYGSIGQYVISGTTPVAIGFAIGNTSISYVEDSPAQQITTTAQLVDATPGNYSNTSLRVTIASRPGNTDQIGFEPLLSGFSVSGSDVLFGATTIATMDRTDDSDLTFDFNENTSAANIESLLQSVTFAATGDAPETFAREIRFELDKGGFIGTDSVRISIETTNDAPALQNASLLPINEDSLQPAGQSIESLLNARFSDPDDSASLLGVAVVNNSTPAEQGMWQISTDGAATWQTMPEVNDDVLRLSLGADAMIRFVPGQDFFGEPEPLAIRAIDNSFVGSFTTPANFAYLTPGPVGLSSPVAGAASFLGINVLAVNDRPFANIENLSFSVLQDQPLSANIPATAFGDIDDLTLELEARLANGQPLPTWLRLNPVSLSFSGVPRSSDVGPIEIELTARDSGNLTASIPVTIDVINVNDPPTDIRFSPRIVPENTPGAIVGRLAAFDPDGDEIVWTIDDSRFEIEDSMIRVKPFVNLDFETEPLIATRVFATDSGTPPYTVEQLIEFTVGDVNEFTPNMAARAIEINRNTPGGTTILTLLATDNDTQQTVTYSLTNNSDGRFTLDPQSGELRITDGIDLLAVEQESFKVFARATDSGTPSRSRTVSVDILLSEPIVVSLATEIDRLPIRREGLSLGVLSGVDQNGDENYAFDLEDDRFELVEGVVRLKPSVSLTPSDIPLQTLQVRVTDTTTAESLGTYDLEVEIFDAAPWQNYDFPLDVDRNGQIDPRDALLVINNINKNQSRVLSSVRTAAEQLLADIDVTGDNELGPIDALRVIYYLNKNSGQIGGEGEGESSSTGAPTDTASGFGQSDLDDRLDSEQAAWIAAWESIENDRRQSSRR